jgi:cell shape-determining protein MreC
MARSHHHHPLVRSAMPAAVVVLTITALTPVRFLEWTGWLGGFVATVVTPVSDPVRRVSSWMAPPTRVEEPGEQELALERDRSEFRRLYFIEKRRVAELEARIADLEAGFRRAPNAAVSLLTRPVVGSSSDASSGVLVVRAGRADGVTKNTVTTVRGVQLHGQVVSVDRLVCRVMPITEPETGFLGGRVLLDRTGDAFLSCQLAPTGSGTFRGEVEFRDPPAGARPEDAVDSRLKPGVEVVLDDPEWPESAQMFMIGVVERVEPDADQPLRSVVIVRPRDRLELRRVREVVLRVPVDGSRDDGTEDAEGGEGTP